MRYVRKVSRCEGRLVMTSHSYFLEVADGYLEYNAHNSPVVFATCMPWGTPVALFATKTGAEQGCLFNDQSKEMIKFREQNIELGIPNKYGPSFTVPLNIPTLLQLTSINGVLVKSSQVYALRQSEVGVLERLFPNIQQEWLDKYTPDKE